MYKMDNGDSENGSLTDTFLAGNGQFLMQPDDCGEGLGMSGDSNDHTDSHKDYEPLREQLRVQDRFLPIANVARIMKSAIPKSGKIAKDAKECVQECVSEFVSFITSEASERCQQEKRKTINGEDILFAMSALGFDNYMDSLKLYLQKYRDAMKGDKGIHPGQSSESQLEEIGEESFTSQGMSATLMSATDQGNANSGVIYAATYPGIQVHF